MSEIQSLINEVASMKCVYNISISGPVGSGKTTLCEYINKQVFDKRYFNYYNEWIEHDLAGTMLEKCSNKLISRLTLQSFIMDEWNNQLNKIPLKSFNLFERSISECSMCFHTDLSIAESFVLKSIEEQIAKKYNIPSIDTPTLFYEAIEESIEKI